MTELIADKLRILVIDDEPFFLDLLSQVLSDKFHVSLAKNGRQGFLLAQGETRPDIILLDVIMPEIDGYQTCKLIKENPVTQEIPIIFLTAKHNIEDELKGFNLGASDYITKPISVPILLARIQTQLALSQQKIALEQLVHERTIDLERTKDAIVYSMGEMAESRDEDTGNHLLRTREYVFVLAEQLALNPHYSSQLSDQIINAYQRAAPLHDIGKIAIPDKILLKAGSLTPEERKTMNHHPILGKKSISRAENKIGSTLFIKVAKEIAYSHHEKWDGTGYPEGLKGNQIPLSARLMALADVYDALISKRCYKEAMSHEESVKIIIEESGKHFDPEVINAFKKINMIFKSISETYKDE